MEFSKEYGFEHVTSSPIFPQSNGQAESGVKVAKKILLKSKDPNIGLLNYRSTKLSCGYSPSELMMGRNMRTMIPATTESYIPDWTYLPDFRQKRKAELEKQATHFNKRHRVRLVANLEYGDRVWITDVKRFGQIVNISPEPRSYVVKTADQRVFRRNRSFLLLANQGDVENDFDVELPEENIANTSNIQVPVKEVPPVVQNEAQNIRRGEGGNRQSRA